MKLIENIEALRRHEGMTKTEMASQFGVIYQNYNNWVARSSLPKEHYEKAYEILNKDDVSKSPSGEDEILIQKLRQLGGSGQRAVELMIDEMLDRTKE